MNDFIHAIDGFNTFQVWYTDTDSLYINEESYYKLQGLGYVGNELGQGKNDNKGGAFISMAIFAGPKMKYCELTDGSTSISFKGIYKDTITKDMFLQIL